MPPVGKAIHRHHKAPGEPHYYYWRNGDDWVECGHCNRLYFNKWAVRLHQELKHANKVCPPLSVQDIEYIHGKFTDMWSIKDRKKLDNHPLILAQKKDDQLKLIQAVEDEEL